MGVGSSDTLFVVFDLLSFVRLHRIPKRFAQPLNRDPVGHLVLTCGLAQEVSGAPADWREGQCPTLTIGR